MTAYGGVTTPYGFQFGPALVERLIEHKGAVVLAVKTPACTLEITVTPTGRIRVASSKGEWKVSKKANCQLCQRVLNKKHARGCPSGDYAGISKVAAGDCGIQE